MGKKKVHIQLGKMEKECGEEERGFLADNGTICGMENRKTTTQRQRPAAYTGFTDFPPKKIGGIQIFAC